MASLITSAIIAKETLLSFENNLVLARNVDWSYNDKFGNGDDQIGNTYSLRKPINVIAQNNNMAWVAANASITENKVTLVIDRTLTVPMSFSEGDLALKIERFSDRYIKKATASIAAQLDMAIAGAIVNSTVGAASADSGLDAAGLGPTGAGVANAAGYAVGAYGTALTTDTLSFAKKVLQDRGCPDDGDVYAVLSTSAHRSLVLAQATIFNSLTKIDDNYRKGYIGNWDGLEVSYSQSLVSHTNGAQPTLAVSAGSAASGWAETGTLTVTATTGAIKAGDIFQFPGRYVVNPLTKQVTDLPFQVQVLADYAIGATSVAVSPAPIHGGAYQNVSASVNTVTAQLTGSTLPGVAANGATAINLSGIESLVFHKSAICVASPAFSKPKKAVEMAEIIENDEIDGFRIRFIRDYDSIGASGSFGGGVGVGGPGSVNRFDSMYGIKVANNEWIVRVRS